MVALSILIEGVVDDHKDIFAPSSISIAALEISRVKIRKTFFPIHPVEGE
jgi:hypothetical protein